MTKVGRNELCPCGSGKKYKRCCALRNLTANGGTILYDLHTVQIHSTLRREDDFHERLTAYVDEVQRPFLERLKEKSLAGKAAADALAEFLAILEEQIADICRQHSPLYWLNSLRRLPHRIFRLAGDSGNASGMVRKMCEAAVLKYALYEASDWTEASNTGGIESTTTSSLTFAASREDTWALVRLVGLAARCFQVGRLVRRVGKGATLLVGRDTLEAVFAHADTERLVELHDHRAFTYSTLVGNLGILGARSVRKIDPRPDMLLRWTDSDVDPKKYVSMMVPVESELIPPEAQRLRYNSKTYIMAHSNYLRIPVRIAGLLEALQLTKEFRRQFIEVNSGLTPEEVLFCVWVADITQMGVVKGEPLVWQQLRSAGFCSYSAQALLTMWKSVAEAREFIREFPREVVQNVREDKGELLQRFWEQFAFTPEGRRERSIDAMTIPFLIKLSDEFVIVDFTRLTSLFIEATAFVLEERVSDLDKTKRFEWDVERFLRAEAGISAFAVPTGHVCQDESGPFAQVDVAPIVDDCLVWVECKTGRWSERENRGDYRAVRNRWSVIATDHDSWLNQAARGASRVARQKTWKNGGLPKGIKWILPVVCSSRVEYIPDADEMYWLTETIPRICTAQELAEFLKGWDWGRLSTKPFMIQVS